MKYEIHLEKHKYFMHGDKYEIWSKCREIWMYAEKYEIYVEIKSKVSASWPVKGVFSHMEIDAVLF